jgi:phosphatidylglycerophosphatase A
MIYPPGFWRNPIHWLAFGFGSGRSPIAPGTAGTIAAVPFVALLLMYTSLPVYLALVALASVAGIYFCGATSKALKVHDHGGIVWDEFVGYAITMIALPPHWIWLGAGFILFRFFDIIKPWPIKWLDKHVSGGFGIMIDDIIAGLFSWGLLQCAYWYLY